MFKTMKKRIKNEKGLTLIELLAVIVILAIVAAIAVPAIGNIIENSRYSAVKSDAINVINAANIYFTDNAEVDVVDVATLTSQGYL
ncbi:MAG TPA: prepilin-type N-terminal cleavage/methylation domain-containing protein, partial [Ureibacillus sp.]|nr:prepilin-type N-terminal cleavage/methylation domain-containing protein [Ureibacillus sp.]